MSHRKREFLSKSVEETEAIATALAAEFRAGDCVVLHGDLGAGKTQFARGLVKALGGDGREVSSPTYVLLNIYKSGSLVVYHLDAYRVHGADDFEGIGFGELLEQGGIVVVEWGSKVDSLIPANAWHIDLKFEDQETRRITVR